MVTVSVMTVTPVRIWRPAITMTRMPSAVFMRMPSGYAVELAFWMRMAMASVMNWTPVRVTAMNAAFAVVREPYTNVVARTCLKVIAIVKATSSMHSVFAEGSALLMRMAMASVTTSMIAPVSGMNVAFVMDRVPFTNVVAKGFPPVVVTVTGTGGMRSGYAAVIAHRTRMAMASVTTKTISLTAAHATTTAEAMENVNTRMSAGYAVAAALRTASAIAMAMCGMPSVSAGAIASLTSMETAYVMRPIRMVTG